jgi:hypothetical protein
MFASAFRRVGALSLAVGGSGAAVAATAAARMHSHPHSHDSDRLAALERRLDQLESDVAAKHGISQRTGQGEMVFSWDEGLTAKMPADARAHERDMHGGFAEDALTGDVYTGIPGVGLFRISNDLQTWTKVGTDSRLAANIHGLVVIRPRGSGDRDDDEACIALAQNEAQRVLICGLDGGVRQVLSAPLGGEFGFGEANHFYSSRRGSSAKDVFNVTDVTYLETDETRGGGQLFVVTGYCEGDFCLTATRERGSGEFVWGPTAWGGKGEAAGRFKTAHGVHAHRGSIFIANREKFEVLKFSPEGRLIQALPDMYVRSLPK